MNMDAQCFMQNADRLSHFSGDRRYVPSAEHENPNDLVQQVRLKFADRLW